MFFKRIYERLTALEACCCSLEEDLERVREELAETNERLSALDSALSDIGLDDVTERVKAEARANKMMAEGLTNILAYEGKPPKREG
jgi:SMC interacting uncharacterized protein involved in chromosome segregation